MLDFNIQHNIEKIYPIEQQHSVMHNGCEYKKIGESYSGGALEKSDKLVRVLGIIGIVVAAIFSLGIPFAFRAFRELIITWGKEIKTGNKKIIHCALKHLEWLTPEAPTLPIKKVPKALSLKKEPVKISSYKKKLPKTPPDRDKLLNSVPIPSNMGVQKPLKSLSNQYKMGAMKKGLESYNNEFDYRSIRGDGHCLFRSIAASIAIEINKISDNKKAKALIFNHIEERIDLLQALDPELKNLWQKTKILLENLKGTEESLHEVMQNSDEFVHFLRLLACITLLGYPDLTNLDIAAEEANPEQYLNAMKSMGGDNPVYGGHPEIVALAFILNRNINVLDPEIIGKELFLNDKAPPPLVYPHNRFNTDAPGPTIWLLHRGMHYDLALKR